jgi:hypothetical protein
LVWVDCCQESIDIITLHESQDKKVSLKRVSFRQVDHRPQASDQKAKKAGNYAGRKKQMGDAGGNFYPPFESE